MAEKEPPIKYGRRHYENKSVLLQRTLEFGIDIAPEAHYLFSEAERVAAVRGIAIAHAAKRFTILPIPRDPKTGMFTSGFSPLYDAHMRHRLFQVTHRFHGIQSTHGTHIVEGTVFMRNEADLGAASLTFTTDPLSLRRRFSLKQAESAKELDSSEAVNLLPLEAAGILRGILHQHGANARAVRNMRSFDKLCLMLSSPNVSPEVGITKMAVYDTTPEGSFAKSTFGIVEEVDQTRRSSAMVRQEVGCRGLVNYSEFPGILGTIGVSIADDQQSPEITATIQAAISLPEDHFLGEPERNYILNKTVEPYMEMHGFVDLLRRQLSVL